MYWYIFEFGNLGSQTHKFQTWRPTSALPCITPPLRPPSPDIHLDSYRSRRYNAKQSDSVALQWRCRVTLLQLCGLFVTIAVTGRLFLIHFIQMEKKDSDKLTGISDIPQNLTGPRCIAGGNK